MEKGRAEDAPTKALKRSAYTIAIVCALPLELDAMSAMLDCTHEFEPASREKQSYTLGSIAGHNVVLASRDGAADTTAVVSQLLKDFGCIRFGLMVGVGSGIPRHGHDIRSGDVVVGMPTSTTPSVISFERRSEAGVDGFEMTGWTSKPPKALQDAVLRMRKGHNLYGGPALAAHLEDMWRTSPTMRSTYVHQGQDNDILFESAYRHEDANDCSTCDKTFFVVRPVRQSSAPEIFYGSIASSEMFIEDPAFRDALGARGISCVETEAAALPDRFPCLVIRGIQDYADSHKTTRWQCYAAATAAACAKVVLLNIDPKDVEKTASAKDLLDLQQMEVSFGANELPAPPSMNKVGNFLCDCICFVLAAILLVGAMLSFIKLILLPMIVLFFG